VAGAAVGEANQLDDVAEGAPLRRGAADLDIGVIRMGAEDKDSRRLRGRFHDGSQGSRTVNGSKPHPYSGVVLIFSTSLSRFKGFLDNGCGCPHKPGALATGPKPHLGRPVASAPGLWDDLPYQGNNGCG